MIRPRRRRGIAVVALAWVVAAVASPAVAQPQPPAQKAYPMPEIVVTATGRPEPLARVAGTVQVIDQDRIAKSTAKSVTELFAENAVGFMSEWTPGQTSLNIRGGATDGQGRDFRSQILVLINGHRAGTANISKLSTADVERIEIVRGPSSVVYGSQNMGGVVNIILKTGRTAPGIFLEGSAGSWQMVEGRAQYGGISGPFDWYVGGFGQTQGNFQIGGGAYEQNSSFTRASGTVALGYAFDALEPVIDVTCAPTASMARASAARAPTSSPTTSASIARSSATFNGRRPTAAWA
jgi:vitamin B12 transporter